MILAAYHDEQPPAGRYLASYRISGRCLVQIDPWTKINGEKSELVGSLDKRCRARQDVGNMMRCCHGAVAIFRTDSLKDPVWEDAVNLRTLPDNDDYQSMTVLLNDLYLGTRHGNLYILRELYKPA